MLKQGHQQQDPRKVQRYTQVQQEQRRYIPPGYPQNRSEQVTTQGARPGARLRLQTGPQVTTQEATNRPNDREGTDDESNGAHMNNFDLRPEGATRNVETDKQFDGVNLDPTRKSELKAAMNYLYTQGDGMPQCQSMQVAIKRILQNKIFKSVKFLPRNSKLFKYPDFVDGTNESAVKIVNGLLGKMNLSHYNIREKTQFWITYNELFRQYFTEHRSATAEGLKRVFFDNALGKRSRIIHLSAIQRHGKNQF